MSSISSLLPDKANTLTVLTQYISGILTFLSGPWSRPDSQLATCLYLKRISTYWRLQGPALRLDGNQSRDYLI